MSTVHEIETAIAQLKPSEQRVVAAWIKGHCAVAEERVSRPRFDKAELTPVICSPDAFAPLTEEELAAFGLS